MFSACTAQEPKTTPEQSSKPAVTSNQPKSSKPAVTSNQPESGNPGIAFSSGMRESEGQIYVDGTSLTVTINIDRETLDYWELQIVSGEDVFTLLEDNPPGKIAQYGHSWIFEAVRPGGAVMEFVLYDEGNNPKGQGYRFAFAVDDALQITSESEYADLTGTGSGDTSGIPENNGVEAGGFGDNETADMLFVISGTLYEAEPNSLVVSPYRYYLLGEESLVYLATFDDGRECEFIALQDGSVYINENKDAPVFKNVSLGNYIVIGEPVDGDYVGSIARESLAQEVADNIGERSGGTAIPAEGEHADIIVDHRQVIVFGISYGFDVGGYIAVDMSAEHVYYGYANGEYHRVAYDSGSGGYTIGEKVNAAPKM
jgi:hypothetical protein